MGLSAGYTAVFDCLADTMDFVVSCTRVIEANNVCTCSHTWQTPAHSRHGQPEQVNGCCLTGRDKLISH